MNAWSHLPNAAHIDRVLESSKSHPEVWDAARTSARSGAWVRARSVSAYDAAYNAAYNAAAYSAAWDAACDAARGAARIAILALIAYDDAAKYLDMSSDQLKVWAILSEDPAAVLLSPAVIAYEKIDELETV